jgi:NDP-sugar pyrophosphorylase family protein
MTQTLAILFASGRGKRLRPFTDHTPKPLAQVKGKSLLDYNIEKAQSFVDKYCITVHWMEDKIRNHIDAKNFDKPIQVITQKNLLGGTLDALRTGIYADEQNLKCNYFVSNSDEIRGDKFYQEFAKSIAQNPDQALIAAKKLTNKEELKNYGVLKVDSNHNLIQIVEKPQEFVSDLISIGMYYLPNNIVSEGFISNDFNQTEQEQYIPDLFNSYTAKYPIKVIELDDLWLPITTLSDLEAANNDS